MPRPAPPRTASSRPARSARPDGAAVPPRRPRPGAGEPLALDPVAAADPEGLADEVALLRAAIRRLAADGDAVGQLKPLAELRHQVGALCAALRTQRALAGREADALSATLAEALEELGDELGVPE